MKKILFVDDDPQILKGYQRQLADTYDVDTALGGVEGLSKIEGHGPYAVVISDMRMPEMDGVQFLSNVRECSPDTVRMMLTGYADIDTAMDAVNKGNIFRFLTKPCTHENLCSALNAGLGLYRIIRSEKELLEQTLSGSLKALTDVLSLVNPEIFGRTSRIKRYVLGLAQQMGLSEVWQLEIAASLSQIGCLMLPNPVLHKINRGQPLIPGESYLYKQIPEIGAALLANIPRMDEVSEIIKYQQKRFDGTGIPQDSKQGEKIILGARLLKVALDFDSLRVQGHSSQEAFDQLRERREWYDPQVLEALGSAFIQEKKLKAITLSLSELGSKMIVAAPIKDHQGNILVTEGQELTDWMVARLKQLGDSRAVKQPIQILTTHDPLLSELPHALGLEMARRR